jgi:hypothetical protein
VELLEHEILRLIWRLAYWADTFFSGALEARTRLALASCRLHRILRKHGEDSDIRSKAQCRAADAQFAAEYWTEGSQKLRNEIDIAIRSGVSSVDLRLLSLNRVLVVEEDKLAVLSERSPKSLTPIAIAVLSGMCVSLILFIAFSDAATRHKILLVFWLAAALSYLLLKWHQRWRLVSGAQRRVAEYLKHRGPVPNVSRLRRKWPHVALTPTWNPPSPGSPTRSEYRNLRPQKRRQRS